MMSLYWGYDFWKHIRLTAEVLGVMVDILVRISTILDILVFYRGHLDRKLLAICVQWIVSTFVIVTSLLGW